MPNECAGSAHPHTVELLGQVTLQAIFFLVAQSTIAGQHLPLSLAGHKMPDHAGADRAHLAHLLIDLENNITLAHPAAAAAPSGNTSPIAVHHPGSRRIPILFINSASASAGQGEPAPGTLLV